jgi:hypothetical protein
MATNVQPRAGKKITVGAPDGPHIKIPAAYTITVTGEAPYDLRLDVTWDANLGRHTLHQLTITEQPDGDYVRMSQINQIALAEIIERSLANDVLGGPGGWQQLVAEHGDDDPIAVDALVYLLSHALGGQSPSATIAIARGLSPASGPKRAANARQAGLIPPAVEPGKAFAKWGFGLARATPDSAR